MELFLTQLPPVGGTGQGFPLSHGRSLLASSHAGTRLPIAASKSARTQGAPPRPAVQQKFAGSLALFCFPSFPSFDHKQRGHKQKGRHANGIPAFLKAIPTLALPKSGRRVEAAAASSQPVSQAPRCAVLFSLYKIILLPVFVKETMICFCGGSVKVQNQRLQSICRINVKYS